MTVKWLTFPQSITNIPWRFNLAPEQFIIAGLDEEWSDWKEVNKTEIETQLFERGKILNVKISHFQHKSHFKRELLT